MKHALLIFCLSIFGSLSASEISWSKFHAKSIGCHIDFPKKPERMADQLKKESKEMSYEGFISAADEGHTFMVLAAKFPQQLGEAVSRMTLESLLNGFLSHKKGGQLLKADLVLYEGHEALEFMMRSGGQYFQGRALMVKDQLYLIGMECELGQYNEQHYTRFINSFRLL